MSGDLEAAGDAVTGGLLAGTVARGAWWRRGTTAVAQAEAHGACADCGTALVGPHCHQCGQAGHLHSTMGGFAHEVLHGVFHFEGKIWRTLPMLAFHPGQLTRRYIDGERTRFVTPMALFLFSVFLLFAIVAQLPALKGTEEIADQFGSSFAGPRREIADKIAQERDRLATLEADRARLAAQRAPTATTDSAIAQARSGIEGLEKVYRTMPGLDADSPKVTAKIMGRPITETERRSWFEAKLAHVRENPKLFIYKMKTAGYKYSWALIPISLPFIWLMFFWKRRFGMYDHAIFATYSLSFMSLLVVLVGLGASYGSGPVVALAWTAFALIPPIHMYKQLKYGYLLTRFGAAWRTLVLLVLVSFSATLFFLLLLYMGAAG